MGRSPLEAIAEGAARGAVEEIASTAGMTNEWARAYQDRNRLAVAFAALVGGFYGHHHVGVYDNSESDDESQTLIVELPNGTVGWEIPKGMLPEWIPERIGEEEVPDREGRNDRLDQFAAEIGDR
ncbi:hypothetical protein HSRCO_0289 [Halanaeroarchaeum sp. HSR-CO]|uniref:hypothetical protein n=1 Tax=Halanaeroarchaeum sp. HSR-CO TaxID=2866382 RepID=UPI00217D5F73|nr:hypothetical protein [Halanaeroarchaeum sp. HSR-CO]UWG46588.1 hypothetical protein HSRCO_0289 [Halanaeroarchaeum sp. HSR-CO]